MKILCEKVYKKLKFSVNAVIMIIMINNTLMNVKNSFVKTGSEAMFSKMHQSAIICKYNCVYVRIIK
jgi:hypothetical protein